MQITDERRTRIKQIMIDRLNLSLSPDEIPNDGELFTSVANGGLGLDSVDALELAVALNAEFDIEIGDEDMGIFETVDTMCEFVDAKLPVG